MFTPITCIEVQSPVVSFLLPIAMIYSCQSNKFFSYLTADNMASSWPQWKTLPSDYNMAKFLMHIRRLPHHDQDRMTKLPIMEHYPGALPIVFTGHKNKTMSMRQTECQADDCQRCISEMGGYRFQFVGPWTCQAVLAQEFSPYQSRKTWMECTECPVCCK